MSNVQTLTIGVGSRESGRAFLDSLRGLEAELVESEEGDYQVQIKLDGDRDVNDALGVIDRHVTERADGPARLDLDGRRYLIEPVVQDC